jgi:flagellar protein FlbT
MQSSSQARSAYAATPIRSARGAEYAIFAQVTKALMSADPSNGAGFGRMAEAVVENQRLWGALAEDLMHDQNRLPVALRAQLVSLAEFVRRHSMTVLGGKGSLAPLIDINTAIMKGLRGEVGGCGMSGLVLKLGPRERILVNGVVIENGDRRARFNILTPDANVLRLRDAIHPEEVNTPVRRVCYIAQLVLAGEADPEEAGRQLSRGIEQLSQVFQDPDSRSHLDTATAALADKRFYQTLRALRCLIQRETRLLGLRDAS